MSTTATAPTFRAVRTWRTVCTLPYSHPLRENQDPRAHGGHCVVEVRKVRGRLQARKVNVNGQYRECGDAYAIDDAELTRLADRGR